MGTISPAQIADGTTMDASDVNNPINTIANEFNGNIDNSNIKTAAAIDASKLAGGTTGMFGAWISWTPTFVNLSGGTLNYSKYTQIGKLVNFRIKYTLAGAGVGSGVTFSTPTSMTADMTANSELINGVVSYFNSGSAIRAGSMRWASSTTITLVADNGTTVLVDLSSTVPHTWKNADVIQISGSYEAL